MWKNSAKPYALPKFFREPNPYLQELVFDFGKAGFLALHTKQLPNLSRVWIPLEIIDLSQKSGETTEKTATP